VGEAWTFDNQAKHSVVNGDATRVHMIMDVNPNPALGNLLRNATFDPGVLDAERWALTGGLRWERLEGYLPEQSSPPSVFYPSIQRSFPEARDVVLWHTAGPRASAVYDVTGDGKTAAKASYGRYYYLLPTGGSPFSLVNPNANYFTTYTWNDVNNDLKFQPGEQTGAGVLTTGTTTTIDPNYRRPYTDEYSFGVDRELMANFKMSAAYTYRRERYLQASANPDNPYATTPTTAVEPGIDGVLGTGDDGTYSFFQRISAANRTLITNDPTVLQSYKGLEITLTKRLSNRWQMLAGYTYGRNRIENSTVDVSPNFLINANGNITSDGQVTGASRCAGCGQANADRPNQFKLTGMYVLPWHEVILSGNFRSQQGPAFTRQISRALAIGAAQTINLEPLGSSRIGTLTTIDLRVGKLFRFNNSRSLEASVDFDNLMNADTVWNVRSLTPATTFTDPTTGTRATLQQFLSPTQILVPRTVVLRAAFKF